MIIGMDHTGFIVSDVDKMASFYKDVLGFKEVRVAERDGGPASQVVGYDNVHYKAILMNLGEGHVLELIQYMRPEGADRPTEERAVIGASHIAFRVEDVDATFKHLVDNGAKPMNPPTEIVPGHKGCYLQDPEGNWIELLETNL